VRALTINPAALTAGQVEVETLECLMPDGTLVQFTQGESVRPLTATVGAKCVAGGPAMMVYLAMPRSLVGKHGRYVEADATFDIDQSGHGEGFSVDRMRLSYELRAYYVDHALPADQSLCPLMKVARDANGTMRLGDFHPPMLALEASAFLNDGSVVAQMRELTNKIWLKIDELASSADEQYGVDDMMSAAASAQLNAARVLADSLPLLDVSVNDGQLHPRELYRVLAAVVGPLAGLGGHPLPLRMAPYNHDNCQPQFQAVCHYIEARLDSLHAEYERFRFTPFKEGYSRRLFEEMDDNVIIELKPQAGQTLADITNWLKAANIASDDMLLTVQSQRQNGADAHRITSAEARKLRLPVDAALFMLKNARILSRQQNAYQAGSPLMIQGGRREHMPALIYLYRRKRTARPAGPDATDANVATVAGHEEDHG
jgi:type VI secretion system protein ImpJ